MESRERWQAFKKKHPAFEKSKNFKSDVGPQLEKFDKARHEFEAIQHSLEAKCAEVFKIGNSVAAALKGYEAIVKELHASDQTIEHDFNEGHFNDFADRYVKQYAKVTVS